MKRKLIKKALSAILVAAMLITSNGIASAANRIYVEGIYINFPRATMSTGTTKQIVATVEPTNATVKRLVYSSSNPEVATVDAQGLITAVAPGTAEITIKAMDGSSEIETIDIVVLQDLYITKSYVDNDNEVVIIDGTYGNITIDSSVGDATIYLSGVTVKNILTLDSGNYTLEVFDSTFNKVIAKEVVDEISSFSTSSDQVLDAPKVNFDENTSIADLLVQVSSNITKADGTKIDNLTVARDEKGQIIVTLDGFTEDLLVDASIGNIELVLKNSNLDAVKVSGNAKDSNIVITNGDNDSSITNVIVETNAKLVLGMSVETLDITAKATGSTVTTKSEVSEINYNATTSTLNIESKVDSITVAGAQNTINIAFGASINSVDLDGKSNKLLGDGKVEKIAVNADNSVVHIIGATVTISQSVKNVIVNEQEAVPGQKIVAQEPPVRPDPVDEEIYPGKIVLYQDFEDGFNKLTVVQGSSDNSPLMMVVDGGKDSNKALKVYNKSADWNGVGMNLYGYLDKNVTLRFRADMKSNSDGNLKISLVITNPENGWRTVNSVTAVAGEWYTLEGTFELTNDITSASVYFEGPGDSETASDFYLDNILITVDSIGATPVSGIHFDRSEVKVEEGSTVQVVATVEPSYADNKNVIYESENEEIATVTPDGVITGISIGETQIIATSEDGGYKAYCKVIVVESLIEVEPIVFDFESIVPTFESMNGLSAEVIAMSEMHDLIGEELANSSRMVMIENGGYESAPIFTVTLPEGKTLADFAEMTVDYYGKVGTDVTWKTLYFLAGDTISSGQLTSHGNIVGQSAANPNGFLNAGAWATGRVTIDQEKAANLVSGNQFQISIGMNANTGATYFLDNITLITEDGEKVVLEDFEGGASTSGKLGTIIAASNITKDEFADIVLTNHSAKVLKVTHSNYGQAIKFKINLAPNTKISDYEKLSFSYYLPSKANGDAYTWKDYRVFLGTSITTIGEDAPNLLSSKSTSGNVGTWITTEVKIPTAIYETIGDSTELELVFECPTNSTTPYYLDDIILVPFE